MPDYNSQAIVLSVKNYKEKDRLITAFSYQYGKLVLILKSGLKITSKMAGHLDVGSLVDIEWAKGKYFDLITGASGKLNLESVYQSLTKIIYLKSAVMILDKTMLDNEPSLKIYEATRGFISCLIKTQDSLNIELIYQAWWWQVLKEMGFEPNLGDLKKGDNFFDFKVGALVGFSAGNTIKKYNYEEIGLMSKLIAQPIELWLEMKIDAELVRKGREFLQNFVAWRDINVGQEVFARKPVDYK